MTAQSARVSPETPTKKPAHPTDSPPDSSCVLGGIAPASPAIKLVLKTNVGQWLASAGPERAFDRVAILRPVSTAQSPGTFLIHTNGRGPKPIMFLLSGVKTFRLAS